MPRIFELRSCLQEVQDSLFGLEQENHHHARLQNPAKDWLEQSLKPLGSESEIINIPGKNFYLMSF